MELQGLKRRESPFSSGIMLTQATITRKIVEEEIGSKAISKKKILTHLSRNFFYHKKISYFLLLLWSRAKKSSIRDCLISKVHFSLEHIHFIRKHVAFVFVNQKKHKVHFFFKTNPNPISGTQNLDDSALYFGANLPEKWGQNCANFVCFMAALGCS